MISLFIDTSTSLSTLAILKGNILLKKCQIKSNNDLSNNIFSYIESLFDNVDINISNIKKIFVAIGPGSFTGIRIGVTIAKIIAYDKKIPIIPISSLEIIASTSDDSYIVPIMDARRGYVFAGIYDNNLNIILNDQYISMEDLKHICINNAVFVSNDKLFDNIIDTNINIQKLITKHINDESVDPNLLVPKYLKLTEAEEKLNND